ncbi:putative uncharacterized protein [Parachlamydia acanthamoebae UV-7]|uniref:Uncharacterized protein n=2 Tax=Parachlamydia acanthamoebae TaxID=83552 RepID=F8KVK6_PARAV|nr:efflux RND transporter permease subunit [Parachlamydia acanthamoebae]KIA76345.1 hypothetical protein DB43_AK00050 [Parachlamydia acanthamoebae]CCB85142.1 putative uncharacterized protein [Parachlamydia acanthamoebae UV-7]
MKISDVSIKRPIFALVFSLLLVLFGTLCFFKLPLREYPDVNPPVVSIRTGYTGASADIVETKITQLIEGVVSGIEGVHTIESESQDGDSSITIEFNINRDIDTAAADVRDRVSRILNDLPPEADTPEITKLDSNTHEVIWLRISSDRYNAMELTDYAHRYLVDRLAIVDGVARVRITGERRYAMRIWLDRKALAARGLTVDDIEQALKRENIELPAGRIESYKREFTIRTKRLYETTDDFKNLVIKRGDGDYLVRLGDIAEIEIGPEDKRTELRANGLPAIGIGISKQSKANTLEVTRGVRKELQAIQATLPKDIHVVVSFDGSIFIEAAIWEVYLTLAITLLLVIGIIFIFLGSFRATIIPAITIPISLISVFILLYVLNYSINLLTLLALVLAIGLVVDDAIVVLENIYKKIEAGMPPLAAAFIGTRQVSFAVVATTVVLIAVFIPIAFLEGHIGKLFTEFALTLAGSVAFSSMIALTLCPMLCSKILKKEYSISYLGNLTSGFINRAHGTYQKSLVWVLKHPTFIILTSVTSLPLIYILFTTLPDEFEPLEDRGYFYTLLKAPEGSSLAYMKMHMRKIEKDFISLVDNHEATQTFLVVPSRYSSTGSLNTGRGVVLLEPWEQRTRSSKMIVDDMTERFNQYAGMQVIPIMPKGLALRRGGQPIQLVLQGSSYDELAKWRDIFIDKIKTHPGVINLDHDYKETKPQYLVEIDRDRAASLGISSEMVGKTLETMLGSRKVTTFLDRGEEYAVILQGKEDHRRTTGDLTGIYVRSSHAPELVSLFNLVRMKEISDAASLNRFNRLRAITISGSLAPGFSLGPVLSDLEKIALETLPSTIRMDYKGESRMYKETSASFLFAIALALIIVYLVLAAQFESFIHPFIILTIVPLAILGGLWGIYMWGITINIYSQIGMIMLIGLSAKNSILIVEFANQLRDEGKDILSALKEASLSRFRPILMTALSTAIGALPLVIATGAGAESRISIGVVVFVGVFFSTFLTLYIVPAFYVWMAHHTSSPETTAKELNRQLQTIENEPHHA